MKHFILFIFGVFSLNSWAGNSCLDQCGKIKKEGFKGSAWSCDLTKADIYAAMRVINGDTSGVEKDRNLINNPQSGLKGLLDGSELERERFAMAYQTMRISPLMTNRFGANPPQCSGNTLGIPAQVSQADFQRALGSAEAEEAAAFNFSRPVTKYLNTRGYMTYPPRHNAWLMHFDGRPSTRNAVLQRVDYFRRDRTGGAHYDQEGQGYSRPGRGLSQEMHDSYVYRDLQFISEHFTGINGYNYSQPLVVDNVDLNNVTYEYLAVKELKGPQARVIQDSYAAAKRLLALPNPGASIQAILSKPPGSVTCEESQLLVAASALFSYAANPLTGTGRTNVNPLSRSVGANLDGNGGFVKNKNQQRIENELLFTFNVIGNDEENFSSLRPFGSGGEVYRVHALSRLGFDPKTIQGLFSLQQTPAAQVGDPVVCKARNSLSPSNCAEEIIGPYPKLEVKMVNGGSVDSGSGLFTPHDRGYFCSFRPSRPSTSQNFIALPDYTQFSDYYNPTTSTFNPSIMCNVMASDVIAFGCHLDKTLRRRVQQIQTRGYGPKLPEWRRDSGYDRVVE